MSSRSMSTAQNHRRTTVPERYRHLDDLYPRLLPRPRIRQRTRLAASNVEDLFDPSSAPTAAGCEDATTFLLKAVASLQKRVLGSRSRGGHDGDKDRLFKKALDRALDTGILGWMVRRYHPHCNQKHKQQQYRAQEELREEEWRDKAMMTGFGMTAQKRQARFLAWRIARWQRQARLRQRRDKDFEGWQSQTMTTTMARWRRRRKEKGQSRKRGEMTMLQLLQRSASSVLAWLKRGGSRSLWTVFKLLAKVSPIVKAVLEEMFSERSVEQVEWRMFVREEDEMGAEDEDDLNFEEGEDEEEKGSDEDDGEDGEDHEEEYPDGQEEEEEEESGRTIDTRDILFYAGRGAEIVSSDAFIRIAG
ncbi:hypothetical protein BGZ68_003338 [Mortierella alpina]|nr:hypothetical protein BGZ68_003338 [Mortierella alpina]